LLRFQFLAIRVIGLDSVWALLERIAVEWSTNVDHSAADRMKDLSMGRGDCEGFGLLASTRRLVKTVGRDVSPGRTG